MQVAKVLISENRATVQDLKMITSGTVGATVAFEFDETWDGWTRGYMFRVGFKVVEDVQKTGVIPAELIKKPGVRLEAGVFGTKGDLQLPTIWADLGVVRTGVNPSGDPSTNPQLPVWAQLQQGVEAADQKAEELQKNLGKAVQVEPQDFTEEQQAQARENIGIIDNPDIHAEYFTITDDGVVSLKPEYRGATNKADNVNDVSDMGVGKVGSKNAELPKHLVIPEIVDGKAVHSLALAIFRYNNAVVNVTLPNTITDIPERCFDCANELKNVYNTEHIKTIGKCAFQTTALIRLKCPNLERFTGAYAFLNCKQMVYADIGKVTTLPERTLDNCTKLHMVKSANNIKTVGDRCFNMTPNLKRADFISNLTSIGQVAFMRSGVDFDWAKLTDCTFGTNATPLQYNPTDFWSACSFTPSENQLPTHLCQADERWSSREIGTSGETYNGGCVFFSIMHIYCGLHNIALSSVVEFEEIINSIDANWLNSYSIKNYDIEQQAEALGLNVERYWNFDQTNLQALYDAFAAGKYGIIEYNEPPVGGHVVVAYGINDKGEILLADSNNATSAGGKREPLKYALPISKLRAQANYGDYNLHIVSL